MRYPLVFDIFQRAQQIEAAAFQQPWNTLTLLARAERELFLNTDWLLHSQHGRSTINGKRAPGLEAVYQSAAEAIAVLLHGYLEAFETDGLPLYLNKDGELVEITEFDQFGGSNLRRLLNAVHLLNGEKSAYPQAPEWATMLYHRRSDVYWHSLIAGDVWSGETEARDPVQMYDRQPENHTIELRQKMITDQQAARKAALQAIVRGQIQPPTVGLSAEECSPTSVRHPSEAKQNTLTFSEVLADSGAIEWLSKFRDRFPYLVDLFSRAKEMGKLSIEQWDELSLREFAERELFQRKLASEDANSLVATVDEAKSQAANLQLLQDNAYSEKLVASVRIFSNAGRAIAHNINSYVYDSRLGLPLYEKVDGELRRLDPAHGYGFFIAHLAEEDPPEHYRNDPPSWASRIYVRHSDLEAFELFFGNHESEGSHKAKKRALELLLSGKLFDSDPTASAADSTRVQELEQEVETLKARIFDPDDTHYPEELDLAIIAWRTVSQQNPAAPGQALEQWLRATVASEKDPKKRERLGAGNAIDRMSKVANWNRRGGRPENAT